MKEAFVIQKKILKELLQDLEQELLRLGYTEGTMKFYRNSWQKIKKFAKERNHFLFPLKFLSIFLYLLFFLNQRCFDGCKLLRYNNINYDELVNKINGGTNCENSGNADKRMDR